MRKLQSANILTALEAHPAFRAANTVLLYHSLNDEVDTHEFIRKWSNKKRILLPVVVGDDLELRIYTGPENMSICGVYGIEEPTGEAFTDYAAIDFIGCTNPCVDLISQGFTELCIGAPAGNGQQSSDVNTQPLFSGNLHIEPQSLNQILCAWQITPRSKRIDIGSNRMNDVVDAVLDDYRICAGYFYLPWKSGGTFQSVGIIRDIVVLPQNACAAGGFPNNCGSAVSILWNRQSR